MTKTVREREGPSSLPFSKTYTLFRLHFTPDRSVQHCRAEFFDLKKEDGESAADIRKRILEVKKKANFLQTDESEHKTNNEPRQKWRVNKSPFIALTA